jgi:hypothetical protein
MKTQFSERLAFGKRDRAQSRARPRACVALERQN